MFKCLVLPFFLPTVFLQLWSVEYLPLVCPVLVNFNLYDVNLFFHGYHNVSSRFFLIMLFITLCNPSQTAITSRILKL